jgi:hypothetical protein
LGSLPCCIPKKTRIPQAGNTGCGASITLRLLRQCSLRLRIGI